MQKKVIITGVAGLIGSHLAYKFLSLGWKVYGIDNLIGGYYSNLPNVTNFTFIQADILNTQAIAEHFKEIKADLVIHCAALAHEGLSVFSPKTICENIYAGTVNICSAAIASGAPMFINTSSMARYGNLPTPFVEDSTPQPIDPYGLAKLHAEQHLNLMSDIYGIKVYHMVPHNVAGPNQCYSDPFRNVMSIFTNLILNNKTVYVYGDGLQKRSFSHVSDCIDAFVSLYEKRDTINSKEVFNIGPSDGTEITILDLAHKVGAACNMEPKIQHMPDRPREVKYAWVDTQKASGILNYKTLYSCDDTIKETVEWIKTQPVRCFNYHLPIEIQTENTPKTWTKKLFN
jgi:UDP-glucose 4-epimerase